MTTTDNMENAILSDDRGAVCPVGWPIVDVTRNYTEGQGWFTRMTVRGTEIVEDAQQRVHYQSAGDLFDRIMYRINDAGYSGPIWFIQEDGYKHLHNNESYVRGRRR